MQKNLPNLGAVLMAAVIAAWVGLFAGGVPGAMGAEVIKSCPLEAAGDGCVFDLAGTGGDFLTIDTRAGTAGNRWRATISEVNLPGAISNVGTGSDQEFTGAVRRRVFSGRTYEIFITFEAPLPEPFPATSVEVRVNGPVNVSGPRPISASMPLEFSAPVEVTGQTLCFDTADIIACDGTGQDGEIQAGVPFPIPRFTDRSNGTVTDNLNGLIWLKDASCLGFQTTWANALAAVADLNAGRDFLCADYTAGTFADWRLPNVKELQSLIHFGFTGLALSNATGMDKWTEGDAFSGVQSAFYWSSTTLATTTGVAWRVRMSDGTTRWDDKLETLLSVWVWPVRGGEERR